MAIRELLNSCRNLQTVLLLVLLTVIALSACISSTILLIVMVATVLIVPGWFLLKLAKKTYSLYFLERVSIAILATTLTLIGIYIPIIFLNGNLTALNIILSVSSITLLSWLIKVAYPTRIENNSSVTVRKSHTQCLTAVIVLLIASLILVHRSIEVFRPEYGSLLVGYDTPFYARIIESYRHGVLIVDEFLVGGLILTDPPAYYILLSTLTSITGNPATITAVIVVISALATIPLFLLYRLISRSDLIALIGVIIYQFSWFSLRFFKDLHKATLANFFLFLGLYLAIYGLAKRDTFRIALGGLSLGLTMIIHGQLIIPIIGCILLYLMINFKACRHRESARYMHGKLLLVIEMCARAHFASKYILVLFACMFTILLPSEIYLYVSGGQPWMRTIALMFSSQTLNIARSSSSETLAFARFNIASIQTVLMTDLIPLLIGGALLVLRGRKEAIWFVILGSCTLVGSQLYTMGILASHAFFLWLYYGVLISLFKAAFILLPFYLAARLKRGNQGRYERLE